MGGCAFGYALPSRMEDRVLRRRLTTVRLLIQYSAMTRKKPLLPFHLPAFALLLAPLFLFLSGCEDQGGLSPELKLRIDDIVECEMLEKQVPGISITVVRNGKALYRRGYGKADIGAGTDVRPETNLYVWAFT